MSPSVAPIVLLLVSNVFMTFAWYGHLQFKPAAVAGGAGELGHRLLRVLARGAGQPHRPRGLFGGELKTMQEVITLLVFAGFSVLYLRSRSP